jgi:hypothetical protein
MVVSGIKGEKKCEVCECTFVNKDNPEAKRCKACEGAGPEAAGANEKFLYQDVKRSDIEAKLNLALTKLDIILKLLQPTTPEKKQEYSKKCEGCGQVFVTDKSTQKNCDICRAAK